MNILITGGTVFVSRFTASYFAAGGNNVYVLNRNTRPQVEGVTLIKGDRHNLGDVLKKYSFDAVLDITAYCSDDVRDLRDALGDYGDYILLSSSAVYPETLPRPFHEDQPIGYNNVWKDYGIRKKEAEEFTEKHIPGAYIIRPPYLYGPMENLYREPFVFDCADMELPFFIPGDGSLPLQFFHVRDLCRIMDIILKERPPKHILNVGNPKTITAYEWVSLCYEAAGKKPHIICTGTTENQRSYFCFNDYAYELDVSSQMELLPSLTPLSDGLSEAYKWHCGHPDDAVKRPYLDYIRDNFSMKNPVK